MKGIDAKTLGLLLFFVIIISIAMGLREGPIWAVGFLVSSAWSIVNLSLTFGLLDMAMLKRPKEKVWLYLFIKFPVLYLLGFAMLAARLFPLASIVWGLIVTIIIIGAVKLWPKLT
ncbi:MAG: hypothetical protein KBB52_03605 [Candidatus Omnitrophica bacterium]|nr:hypothetical protein [Candidatus Omnitrophota bacterium]